MMNMGRCPQRRGRPSFEPRKHNAVLDSMAGMDAFGLVRNFDVGAARLMGAAPSWGEPHLCFAPDARPSCGVAGQFVARQLLASEDVVATSLSLCDQRETAEREWGGDVRTSHFEFSDGRPARLSVGGVGGDRFSECAPRRFRGHCGRRSVGR